MASSGHVAYLGLFCYHRRVRCLFVFNIYLKGRDGNSKWPSWPGLDQIKAGRFFQVSHMSVVAQALGPFSGAFPGASAGNWLISGTARTDSVPRCEACTADSGLSH